MLRHRFHITAFLSFIVLATAPIADAAPDDNYRFLTKTKNTTLVGAGNELDLGAVYDLEFDRNDGTMYAVLIQNGLAVFDAAAGHWKLIDGSDKPPIVGDLKRGLSAAALQSSGRRLPERLDPERLDRMTGYAEKIAVDSNGVLWVTTHDYTIYRRDGAFWQRLPGNANNIAAGADGSVYSMVAADPAPRRDPRKMRPAPEASSIQQWNGSGWNAIPGPQQQTIRLLAVDAGGHAWISHDCPMPGYRGSFRHCIARWTGSAWEDQTLPNQTQVHGLTVDEHGVVWADVSQLWPDKRRARSIQTNTNGAWAHHYNITSFDNSPAMAVRDNTPWLGFYYVDEGRPRIEEGWVRYPHHQLDHFRITRAGDVWVQMRVLNERASHQWFGGNDWSTRVVGMTAPFDNAGNWNNPDIEFPAAARQEGIRDLAPVSANEFVGVTALVPGERRARPQTVYRIANGSATALGAAFRSVSSIAADDTGNAWVKAVVATAPGERVTPEAFYRFTGGAWQPADFPEGFEPGREVMTGLDNAVLIVGTMPGDVGTSTIAMWRDGQWALIDTPETTFVRYAMTDVNGSIWALTSDGLMYQEGTQVSFKVPEPRKKTVVARPALDTMHPMPAPVSTTTQIQAEQTETDSDAATQTASTATEAAGSATPPDLPAAPRTDNIDQSLVGCWAWSNGASITVRADGQAHNGIVAAPWTSIGERRFEITWPDLVTNISVTADGTRMTEESLFGTSGGTRVTGAADSFEGSWRLDNGAVATAAADGSYAVAHLRGTWQSAPGARRYNVSWPLVDTITVSPDGQRLEGANQIGAFTATKKACN